MGVQLSVSREAMRLGYSPFGQTYRKHNDRTFWKLNSGVNANNQLNALMPYQYTGRYTEAATGLVHLDAHWYNPHTQRFVQPDLWNFKNTGLPAEIQHELMRFTGLDTTQLLRDPSQQMAYGYVSGNPLAWTDWLGLCETVSFWSSVGQKLSNSVTAIGDAAIDVAGKVWASPVTAAGLLVGLAGVPFGADVSLTNNAIWIENYPWGNGAITLGNTVISVSGWGPKDYPVCLWRNPKHREA